MLIFLFSCLALGLGYLWGRSAARIHNQAAVACCGRCLLRQLEDALDIRENAA